MTNLVTTLHQVHLPPNLLSVLILLKDALSVSWRCQSYTTYITTTHSSRGQPYIHTAQFHCPLVLIIGQLQLSTVSIKPTAHRCSFMYRWSYLHIGRTKTEKISDSFLQPISSTAYQMPLVLVGCVTTQQRYCRYANVRRHPYLVDKN